MSSLDAWTASLQRTPLLTALGFGLGSALLATIAFSFPPGAPPLSAIVPFAVSLGLAIGVITYVGVAALS